MLRRLPLALLAALSLSAVTAVAVAAPPAPPQPRPVVERYYDSGQYARDTAAQLRRARRALTTELAHVRRGHKPAIVLDIDDTALSSYRCRKPGDVPFDDGARGVGCVLGATLPAIAPTRALYRLALRRHVRVFFITGRARAIRDTTVRNLRRAGYGRYQQLILRPPSDQGAGSVAPFKAGERRRLERAGYDILVNVGDQTSDLRGGYANRAFKLPNPMYYLP